MPIADLCSKSLVSLEKSASVQYAAQLMKTHHVGGVVVVESMENGRPVGILTDRDIALGVVARNLPPDTKVQEVMSVNIVTASWATGIAEAVDRMEKKGVRRMIVMDDGGKACGLVSADDILQLIAREMNGLGRLVERQLENEKVNAPLHSQLML